MKLKLTANVMVVGDVMLDVYISGPANRLSPEAPVPVVLVKTKTDTLGGAGNVALNIAGLGAKVWLFGIRGDDPAGNKVAYILRSRGIEDRLLIDPKIPTITKTRVMANSQQLVRFDEEQRSDGASLLTKVNGVLEKGADAVILSDYDKGILPPVLIASIITRCRVKDIPVFVDPKRGNWERYREATVVKPNQRELEEAAKESIYSDKDTIRLSQKMLKWYEFGAILTTMGSKGMFLITKDQVEHIPTQAKEVFDVAGAGDTVIATMATCMCSGYTLLESAKIANIAAGIVIGKIGTQPITIQELWGI